MSSPIQLPTQAVNVNPPPPPPPPVANPYAATGWRRTQRVEFQLQLPSGQTVLLRRLNRNDLFKLKIIDHLDDLLPVLVDMPAGGQEEAIRQKMKTDVKLIDDMYGVVDVVVMACTLRPAVTIDQASVNYGTEADQYDQHFIPIVHLDDIDIEDKMAIFHAVFGGDQSDFKSAQEPTPSVEPVATVQDVQLPTI